MNCQEKKKFFFLYWLANDHLVLLVLSGILLFLLNENRHILASEKPEKLVEELYACLPLHPRFAELYACLPLHPRFAESVFVGFFFLQWFFFFKVSSTPRRFWCIQELENLDVDKTNQLLIFHISTESALCKSYYSVLISFF